MWTYLLGLTTDSSSGDDAMYEQALVSLLNNATANVKAGQPMAVVMEGGYMAKLIRPTQLEQITVIRHFGMRCLTSARVVNLLITIAN